MEVLRFDDCPACGAKSSTTAFTPDASAWDRFRLLSQHKYQGYMDTWPESLSLEVRRCGQCGHFWQHTQPDFPTLLGMYQKGVSLREKDPAREPDATMLDSMGALYRLAIHNAGEHPTLLDYGSGRGRWTRAAAKAGFCVYAYEPSASRANEGAGDFPTVNNLEELGGTRFDVIILEQVLEHTQEPLKVLRGLSPNMKPRTLLRITVPNVMKIQNQGIWEEFPFDGRNMHIMSPYEHLQGFTPTSLQALLQKAGLIPEQTYAAWRTHPLQQVRFLLGCLLPRIATTLALVRPMPHFP